MIGVSIRIGKPPVTTVPESEEITLLGEDGLMLTDEEGNIIIEG